MRLTKGIESMPISSLEDMVRLHNLNVDMIFHDIRKVSKRSSAAYKLGLIGCAGLLYLYKKFKKQEDDIDRLREEVKNLTSEKSTGDYNFDQDIEFDLDK